MLKKSLTVLLITILVFLSACDSSQQSTNATTNSTVKNAKRIYAEVENIAWMREKLPARTLAYIRIPTLWNAFFETKVDVLQDVQKLPANQDIVEKLKQALVNNYSQALPIDARLPFSLLAKNMTTPLELAVLNAKDGSMLPNVLIATTFKDTSRKVLRSIIETIVNKSSGQLRIIDDMDDKGQMKMVFTMSMVFLSFDENTGRLAIFTGMTTSKQELADILAQSKHDQQLEPIFAYENSVDASGRNTEFWLNLKAIYKQNNAFIPPAQKQKLLQMGLDKANFFWAGTSAKAGKSQFSMHLSMPDVGFRQFLPRVDSVFDVQTAGNPKSVWQIAMPSVTQVQQMYNFILQLNPELQQYDKIVQDKIVAINQFLGVSLAEIYNTYGQKTLLVTDESGFWMAYKIKDKAQHEKILAKLKTAFEAKVETRKLAGVPILRVNFSTTNFEKVLFSKELYAEMENKYFNSRANAFYQIEGDYLLSAFVPQILADRANYKQKVNLQQWLENNQQQDLNQAILAHSYTVDDAPRDVYHMYLTLLPILASVFNTDVDLFALPTAKQLNLPKKGRYGFAIDSSQEALTVRFSYEYSLIENMTIMDSYFATVYIGILMAYAIPAYNDYTLRSKIAGKFYNPQVNKAKLQIAKYYVQHQKFPPAAEMTAFSKLGDNYLYDEITGKIAINLSALGSARFAKKYIVLTPEESSDNILYWNCTSNLSSNIAPTTCR